MKKREPVFIKPSGKVVQDDRLIRREVYNPLPVELIFMRQPGILEYLKAAGITPGPQIVICKPDDFAILNHAFYIAHSKDGRPLEGLVWNYGRFIGIGNKLPARPAW